MLLKTIDFKSLCNIILPAIDSNAANLEIICTVNVLSLNITNSEYYVSCRMPVENATAFHATVDATLFMNLISGISADEFSLTVKDTTLLVKAGKSSYKLPLIFDNDKLLTLPKIELHNTTVEMPISSSILNSILTVNSRELVKAKAPKVSVSELQKMYYITEEGCFTFTNGACLNAFTLDKPIQLLLNERIVKLFKLFKSDVQFRFGYDAIGNKLQTKVVFETDLIYLAALITNDDTLLNRVKGPCMAAKNLINTNYSNQLVLSTHTLGAAISRLMLFTKNSIEHIDMFSVPVRIDISPADGLLLTDDLGNTEFVVVENGTTRLTDYTFKINMIDLKLALDACKSDYINLSCGSNVAAVINSGNISILIKEYD